jgi:hypothetical protein
MIFAVVDVPEKRRKQRCRNDDSIQLWCSYNKCLWYNKAAIFTNFCNGAISTHL